MKVDGATLLEKFITNMQRERAEVAFYIFTNGSQTLEMNLTTRFRHTDATLGMSVLDCSVYYSVMVQISW